MSIASMTMLSLELIGNNRLAPTGIRRIKITPKSTLQLILGTNGSGKSSLMYEMSPLPALSNQFSKDGSKTTEWLKNGSHYKLITKFSNGSQKHSFFKDDMTTNLNPGGTLSVQKQLVLEHFGYDQETHNLLIGSERFTSMSPIRRREWFTKMGSNDYSYALSVFKKLKEKHRDVVGALNMAKFTLVEETAKRLRPEEVEELRRSIADGRKQLSVAIRNMSSERLDHSRSKSEYEASRNLFISSAKKLTAYAGRAATWVFGQNQESAEAILIDLNAQLRSTNDAIHHLSEEYVKVENNLTTMRSIGIDNQSDLISAILKVDSNIELIKSRLKHLDIFEEMASLNGSGNIDAAIESVSPFLRELAATLPPNPDRHLSRKNEEGAVNERRSLILQKEEASSKLKKIDAVIREHIHLRDHAQTECPKCKHIFSKGYCQKTLADAELEAARLNDVIDNLTKSIEQLDKLISEIGEYGRQVAAFSRYMAYDYIRPIRDRIASDFLFNNPAGISGFLDQLQADCTHFDEIQSLLKQREALQAFARTENEFESRSATQLIDRMSELDHQTKDLSLKAAGLNGKIQTYTSMLDCIAEMNALRKATIDLEKATDVAFEKMIVAGIDDCYSRLIVELESALASQETTLRAIDIREGYILELEKDIAKYIRQEKAYAVLIESLSPTDGIIAESLHSFMTVYVRQMNQFISNVWSYPLEIKFNDFLGEESVELNYKFPFYVNHTSYRSDVAEGSRGMEEIFNLSFRMIASQHLGLGCCPLFLDEFGASFDKAHRETATHVVNSLLNHNTFSQLFMVSHYEDGYAPLVDADICVLSDTNVVVPVSDKVNHHVEID